MIGHELVGTAHVPDGVELLTADCLEDARITLVKDDVAMLIHAARDGYDAILLDIDNGPDGPTRRVDDRLYSRHGLNPAMTTLRSGGILAVWSTEPDRAFAARLRNAGFKIEEVIVRARPNGKGARRTIWFAQKR